MCLRKSLAPLLSSTVALLALLAACSTPSEPTPSFTRPAGPSTSTGTVLSTPLPTMPTVTSSNPAAYPISLPPIATPELGILESGIYFEVHVPRRVRIENIWQGYVDDNLTRIYAGQLLPDYRVSTSIEEEETQFGALYVMTFLLDGLVETNLYGTEKETGALRIQSATEEFLILDSTGTKDLSSQVYYYSLNTNRLADSLTIFRYDE